MSARLGRVHLRVTHLDRAIWFYTKALGLRVSQRDRDGACLAAGDGRHELVLQVHDPNTPPPPLWLGCRFVGFEVPSKDALATVCERLGGARATIVSTGDSWSVHTTDPDGNGLEVYVVAPGPSGSGSRSVRTLSLADLKEAARMDAAATEALATT